MRILTSDIFRKGKTRRFKILKNEFWKSKLKGDATRRKNKKKRKRKSN